MVMIQVDIIQYNGILVNSVIKNSDYHIEDSFTEVLLVGSDCFSLLRMDIITMMS